ncbi:MAG TPA: NAD(P)H-dependent oxidoreductase [Candidatus Limnocylindria bacterium]|jgi:NAD(P)H-dependent FMN reductase|nr:NAD(P)H-dependent oxidoreductase [Candidatus Limnocylindria bacterium]
MITLLSGTNRSGSNTRKITAILEGIYQRLGVEYRVLDLQELPPALFTPTAYFEKPAAFEPFSKQILASDGVVVVTPEYNGSFPGVLKLFVDHLKFPESFEQRPVCYVGLAAGMWGALRSVEQLQAIFGYRNAHNFPGRVFMPGIGGLLDDQGQLKDAELLGRLERQAAEFVAFVERLRAVKLKG